MRVLGPPRRPLPLLLHSLSLHAAREAFLIAAVLTAIPLSLVDDTIPLFTTRVRKVLPNCTFKETFASFATVNEMETNVRNCWRKKKLKSTSRVVNKMLLSHLYTIYYIPIKAESTGYLQISKVVWKRSLLWQ